MTLRNLIVILLTVCVSLLCHQKAQWNRHASTISEALTLVERNYFEEVEERALFQGAMRGLVSGLDPNSGYLDPSRFEQFQTGLTQEFGGIGVLVDFDAESHRPTIISPLIDSPAQRAGIRAGDVIWAINGQDTQELTMQRSVALIHGPVGEGVTLSVVHRDSKAAVDIKVIRAAIQTDSVLGDARRADTSWEFFLQEDPRIQLLRLVTFGERTVSELRAALSRRHPVQGAPQGIIVDLRDNAGGLLNTAIQAADLLIDEGLIVSTRGRGGVELRRYDADSDVIIDKNIPLVVLVNDYSASASEILAACWQDHGRAVVMGTRSFGKGTVQNLIPLEGGRSALKLTTASYWRPSGRNIHRGQNATLEDDWGVSPNEGFEVPLSDYHRRLVDRYRRARDLQIPASTWTGVPPGVEAFPEEQRWEQDENAEATVAAPIDDPQLRRAIQYLQQRMSAVTSPSR
ncbi:MAG: S41 family peptidase [Planctomycetota bacterium]